MVPSLKDSYLKLERANEQLNILDIELKQFIHKNPPTVTTEDDKQKSLYILKCSIPVIDPKLAILAGEIVYSLRSSLDHIAWQLALTTTSNPYCRTAFPIIEQNIKKELNIFDKITRDIPRKAVDEIRALQPYNKGVAYKDDLLWKLDKLCNIDKHRIIPAQGTSLNIKIPSVIKPVFYDRLDDGTCVIALPIGIKSVMKFAPVPPTFDILFGSEKDGLVISFNEIPEIYKFVRDYVLPRFIQFF